MAQPLVWGYPNAEALSSNQVTFCGQYVEMTFTKADLLNFTPKTILGPTPNSTYYDVSKVIMEYKWDTANYTAPKDILLLTDGQTMAYSVSTSLVEGANSQVAIMVSNFDTAVNVNFFGTVGNALVLTSPGGSMTDVTGNAEGTLKIKVWYAIRQIA